MKKNVPNTLIALVVLVIVCFGIYYFVFVKVKPIDTVWTPPTGNPPTKQMGVSVTVPE
jgi:hypothetical protein